MHKLQLIYIGEEWENLLSLQNLCTHTHIHIYHIAVFFMKILWEKKKNTPLEDFLVLMTNLKALFFIYFLSTAVTFLKWIVFL